MFEVGGPNLDGDAPGCFAGNGAPQETNAPQAKSFRGNDRGPNISQLARTILAATHTTK
jgi:hypothetical protein